MKNRLEIKYQTLIFFLVGLFSSMGFSQQILLDVGKAQAKKSVLAFPPVQYLGTNYSPSNQKLVDQLHATIKNDLDVTGLFVRLEDGFPPVKGDGQSGSQVYKPNVDMYPEDPMVVGLKPKGVAANGFDFQKWASPPYYTDFLIRAGLNVIGSTAVLEIYAYSVREGKLQMGRKYEATTDSIRRLGHTFANDFYTSITNKPGFFLSQIVVASDTGPQTHKEIFIMDWDGQNSRAITNHKTISFSPDWSRDGSLISYTSFIKRTVEGQKNSRNSDLFIYEVKTGRRWLVSYRKGINSGSHFLPDGKNLLLTLSKGPRTDLFRMSIDGKTIVPLTTGTRSEINVEPTVSKDGNRIAFASDRHGKPMVYMMNADGSNVQRMTFAGNFNSNPSFSPDGKWIAFAGYPDGQDNFELYLLSTDKTSMVRLTRARNKYGGWSNNEEPVFSPDGRQLLFVSDRTGKRQLYMINTDGTNERPITNDDRNYFRPKWGPPGGVTTN